MSRGVLRQQLLGLADLNILLLLNDMYLKHIDDFTDFFWHNVTHAVNISSCCILCLQFLLCCLSKPHEAYCVPRRDPYSFIGVRHLWK